MAETISKYGLDWPVEMDPLQIEFDMIRAGGIRTFSGVKYGLGLFEHFLAARRLVWPERYEHRWTRLIYEEIIKNVVLILMGAASTGKTATAAEWVLLDYWCHPNNTLALVTTTTIEKLESNIFGEIKSLWEKGKERFPWLAGNIVDHKHAIWTDNIEDGSVRDRRKGIMGKPCFDGKQWVGDAVFVGIKQERIRFIGDELTFMSGTFLRSWNPLFSNPDVKVIGSGNPNHNPDDPLGIAAEPKEGWNSLPEPDVTTCWDTKFLEGRCVNLVGTDSPNFDVPEGKAEPYPRLIGRKFMRRVVHDSGPESPDFYRLVKGVMKFSLAHSRVITRQLCKDHHAHDKAEWSGAKKERIYAFDPAYGGGDRCMAGYVEFGTDLNGKQILRVAPPHEIKINLKRVDSPEDQIAQAVYDDLIKYDIKPENSFYGAFGKGTVGFALARRFGANCPIPIEEGGKPTKRPVRQDLRIFDETLRTVRPKRCDEHYSKKITELWFSTRYAIEAEQIRELPEDVMYEGIMREYKTVAGNKIEVESKEDMKERLSRSPDKYDWFSFCVEGARQRGFVIANLGPEDGEESETDDWLSQRVNKHLALMRSKSLAGVVDARM